jgi:hypothetical protein
VKSYTIKFRSGPADISAEWNDPDWQSVQPIKVDQFRPESSGHRPVVECRLQHDGQRIYGLFLVRDNYIRCVTIEHNGKVCNDSCVEFFVEPPGGQGYLNFEFNCGGTMLVYHIRDCRRVAKGFADFSPITARETETVKIFHTLPRVVDPEIAEETTWRLGFSLPFLLFESRFKHLSVNSGQTWRGNFYKCADGTSHPHWASWSPVSTLNFHLPECFGRIVLG